MAPEGIPIQAKHLWYKNYVVKEMCRKLIFQHPGLGPGLGLVGSEPDSDMYSMGSRSAAIHIYTESTSAYLI